MVLEIITLGIIGATYITGDKAKKNKMKNIGREIVDVAKTTAKDTAREIKTIYNKNKKK